MEQKEITIGKTRTWKYDKNFKSWMAEINWNDMCGIPIHCHVGTCKTCNKPFMSRDAMIHIDWFDQKITIANVCDDCYNEESPQNIDLSELDKYKITMIIEKKEEKNDNNNN